jgi:hypothetical protein
VKTTHRHAFNYQSENATRNLSGSKPESYVQVADVFSLHVVADHASAGEKKSNCAACQPKPKTYQTMPHDAYLLE